MRRLTAAIAVLLSLLTLAACGNPDVFSAEETLSSKATRGKDPDLTFHYADGAHEPPTAYTDYSNGVTAFSLRQLNAWAQEEKDSFVFSPLSAALQLNLLANAASAEERQEILMALGNTLNLGDMNACSSYCKSRLEAVSKAGQAEAPDEEVKLDGALLIDQGTDVKTAFLQCNANFFGYDIFRYDFKGEHAAAKLNNYLKPYTDDSGIDVAKGGALHAVSAVKVRDNWLKPTAAEAVFEGSFTGADGARKATYLRCDESKVQSDKATGILKYTEKNPLKLLLILPDEKLGVGNYLSSFDTKELNKLLSSVDITQTAPALIPEISVTSDGKGVPLSGILAKSGLYSLFTDKASFSALNFSKGAKPGEMFEIPPAFSLNRSGINTEGGGNAAAAKAEAPKGAVVFDRPFIFLLLDNESNIPVLAGVYQ